MISLWENYPWENLPLEKSSPQMIEWLYVWLCGRSETSPGKPTWRAVTTDGFNDLVIGEDHIFGMSCQRYSWQTSRWDSIAFGSSPRRGKTLISNPSCLADVSPCEKRFRRQPQEKPELDPMKGVWRQTPASLWQLPNGGRIPLLIKPV